MLDTNRAVQPQKMARVFEISDLGSTAVRVEGLYLQRR